MKKTFLVACLFACTATFADNKTKSVTPVFGDTTALPAILSLNLQSYIGKPVDSLLAVLPSNYNLRAFLPGSFGYCRGIAQVWGTTSYNSCGVSIFINNFQYLSFPMYTASKTWDMTLGKKETISFIRVYKNNSECLFGCNDNRYWD